MGQFGYLFPALVFFVVFFATGKDFLLATAAIMLVVTVQVIYIRLKKGTVEKKLFITWLVLILFGSITLLLRDPIFLQWKVTVINWLFSLLLLGNQLLKRPPILKTFMRVVDSGENKEGMPKLPEKAWIYMTYLWSFAFFFIGLINLYFVFYQDEATWVKFKLFGVLSITFFFAILNAIYVAKVTSLRVKSTS